MPSSSSQKQASNQPGRAVARLARQVAHALDVAQLSMAQYRVLSYLASPEASGSNRDTTGASSLAGRLRVTKPSMTALIDGLTDRNLVKRQIDPNDRRRRSLTITKAGRKALAQADLLVQARLADIASHCDDPAEALAGLAQWNQALTKHQQANNSAVTESQSASPGPVQ